jgi:hypothetical protein
MKSGALIWMAAGVLMARDGQGIRPRPSPNDYPASETASGLTIGAAVIAPEQVKHMFATELNNGYIVVEVAVYPGTGQELDLASGDFTMKIGGSGDLLRAASPRAVASVLQKKNEPRPSRASDVTVYPSTTIGYESGPRYDPVTGQRRTGGGVYTGAGVGVGVGDSGPQAPRPGSTDRDRVTMQQELEDKALPEGKSTQTVAGYLYFPRPTGKAKNALYEINYYGTNGKVRVAVPPPTGK